MFSGRPLQLLTSALVAHYKASVRHDSKAENNKAIVLEAFDTLFNKRDYTAAERFWSPNYIQHSAHIEPGRDGLLGRAPKDECGLPCGIGPDLFYRTQYGAQPEFEPTLHRPQNRRFDENSPDTVTEHCRDVSPFGGCYAFGVWHPARSGQCPRGFLVRFRPHRNQRS